MGILRRFKLFLYGTSREPKISLADTLTGTDVSCPCCNRGFRTFLPFGLIKRANAQCPNCYSLERHRLIWLYLTRYTDIFKKELRLLHVAPESLFFSQFKPNPKIDYYPVDKFTEGYDYPDGTINMDITSIQFEDNFFDVLLCNHVLEHVPDDSAAMSELYRVLKPGGWAILQVPLDANRATTYENHAITDPAEREKEFGQFDHVRVYGNDYGARLRKAGFNVEVFSFNTVFQKNDFFKYGLMDEDIYICKK